MSLEALLAALFGFGIATALASLGTRLLVYEWKLRRGSSTKGSHFVVSGRALAGEVSAWVDDERLAWVERAAYVEPRTTPGRPVVDPRFREVERVHYETSSSLCVASQYGEIVIDAEPVAVERATHREAIVDLVSDLAPGVQAALLRARPDLCIDAGHRLRVLERSIPAGAVLFARGDLRSDGDGRWRLERVDVLALGTLEEYARSTRRAGWLWIAMSAALAIATWLVVASLG